MIFWKYKCFTMDKLPHPKHTSVLLDICHHHTDSHLFSKAFSKLSLNLMEPFKWSIILKIQLCHWRLPYRTYIKKNTISSYSYFYFLFFTSILKMQSNIQRYYPSFNTFYESHFFPGQTPVPPRSGRSGTWILDLSHDPIWAIWLAEVRKFHQHHDRILI